MAKKRRKAQRKATKKAVPQPEAQRLEVQGDLEVMRGRYANFIQITVLEEEFILDLFVKLGEQGSHVGRVFITPQHAKRLADLLKKQITLHKKRFKSSPLAVAAPKRKKR